MKKVISRRQVLGIGVAGLAGGLDTEPTQSRCANF